MSAPFSPEASQGLLARHDNIVPDWALHTILVGVTGSHAHGTHLPPTDEHGTDDTDIFSVCVQPREWYYGVSALGHGRQDYNTNGNAVDVTGYDARKFVGLLGKGNPNVHSWLWSPIILRATVAGQLLLDARQSLLSKRMFPALVGYAISQFKKMQQGSTMGYMGAKRKVLLQRYGYDIKDASHCIRLLHIGIHLARTGELLVMLPDAIANEVRAIKGGAWPLGQVERQAERLLAEFRAAEPLSDLPDEVPLGTLDRLCAQVITSTGLVAA